MKLGRLSSKISEIFYQKTIFRRQNAKIATIKETFLRLILNNGIQRNWLTSMKRLFRARALNAPPPEQNQHLNSTNFLTLS